MNEVFSDTGNDMNININLDMNMTMNGNALNPRGAIEFLGPMSAGS